MKEETSEAEPKDLPDGVCCFHCSRERLAGVKEWTRALHKYGTRRATSSSSAPALPIPLQEVLATEVNRRLPSTPAFEVQYYAVCTLARPDPVRVDVSEDFGDVVTLWCLGDSFDVSLEPKTNAKRRFILPGDQDEERLDQSAVFSHSLTTAAESDVSTSLCVVLSGEALKEWRPVVQPAALRQQQPPLSFPVAVLLGNGRTFSS